MSGGWRYMGCCKEPDCDEPVEVTINVSRDYGKVFVELADDIEYHCEHAKLVPEDDWVNEAYEEGPHDDRD